DPEHGVLQSVLRFAALDRIAHHSAQEAPDGEGEQRHCQGDEEELPQWLGGEPRDRTLARGRFILVAHRDANGEQADDRRHNPLTNETDPSDRLLPILCPGHDGPADAAWCIAHVTWSPSVDPGSNPTAPRVTTLPLDLGPGGVLEQR